EHKASKKQAGKKIGIKEHIVSDKNIKEHKASKKQADKKIGIKEHKVSNKNIKEHKASIKLVDKKVDTEEQKDSIKPAEDFTGNILLEKYFALGHEDPLAPADEFNGNIDNCSILSERGSEITNHKCENENDELSNLKEYIRYKISETHPEVDTSFPFRTDVRAEIKTEGKEPIWSKQYPYPLSVNSFVNKEINRMLNEKIIRQVEVLIIHQFGWYQKRVQMTMAHQNLDWSSIIKK
ncbi:PREDICTED: uncharacterized protein LOC108382936, partial [Rhagoletis zephyria]|uniref:uncharacterized protein LOC108382936 n=1 Tax=Rhagoletis zephyria TaxID=28612 RepID=UPI00081183CA